jgi:hypothetical protein
MDKIPEAALVVLALLGFVAWLGGGRRWAFRTMVSALILAAVGVAGFLLYAYGMEKIAEHRAQKLHECAVAKVADPKCEEVPKNSAFPEGAFICPLYAISDNVSPQQEEEALAAAEQECRGEINPNEKSLHEQIAQYRREHKIVEKANSGKSSETGPWTDYQSKGDVFDQLEKACAARIRKANPGAYNDLDNATLIKKVLAKYPHYCD